jgi:hypothetical protein
MVYARIFSIGGHLDKSPHFYVAHPRAARAAPAKGVPAIAQVI